VAERLDPVVYREIVRRAIGEDIGPGDITTWAIVPATLRRRAVLRSRGTCVLAGLDIAREVFEQVDAGLEFVADRTDGDLCHSGDRLASIEGRAASLLTAERTALNFVQHLSGIATLTRRFVDATGGALTVLDTRKTIPTLRMLAKYAIRCGGAANHRVGLYDGVLIKEQHIRLAGGVAAAVQRIRASGSTLPVEIETQSLGDVEAAIAAGAQVIRLVNLDDAAMREAIRAINGRARVEISGGVTLERIRLLAMMGADCVSVGALTQSPPAADIGMELETE
jgi:nicotinate-nucleotide pyrophosphorylase (carboxylating)